MFTVVQQQRQMRSGGARQRVRDEQWSTVESAGVRVVGVSEASAAPCSARRLRQTFSVLSVFRLTARSLGRVEGLGGDPTTSTYAHQLTYNK